MANYKAVANGNWSNLAIWQDNSSGSFVASTVLPGVSDVVYFNNFTVQINVDVTVSQIRNDPATGVSQGGKGVISTSRIVNSDLFLRDSTLIEITASSPNIVNITGNMPGTFAVNTNIRCIWLAGSATLNYVGNIVASTNTSVNTCKGIHVTGNGSTLNVTGDVYVGEGPGYSSIGNGTHGIYIEAASTVNVVGNLYGPIRAAATYSFAVAVLAANAVTNITGTVNANGGTTLCGGIYVSNVTGDLNITGNLIGSNTQPALWGSGASTTIRLYGNLQNASNGFMAAVVSKLFIESTSQWEFRKSNLTTNTLYTPGVATGHPATNNVRTGIVYGPTNNLTGTCAVPPANTVSVGVPVDNTVGTASLDANALAIALTASLTPALDASLSVSLPPALDASLSVSLDAALSVSLPPAIAPALDTLLSSSLDTALSASLPITLTPALDASLSASLPAAIAPLLWDEDVANLTTPNSIGERVKNCATVATTGAQIASFNP
jgi:hypothetical protein